MAETVVVEEEVVKQRVKVTEIVQKALRLGLGAAAMVQDEIVAAFEKAQNHANELVEKTQKDTTELVDKLVERGSNVEEDGRERVNGIVKDSKKQVNKAQGTLEERIEKVMHRMNVPSKSDIEKLEAKLNKLTKKIEALD